MKNAYFFLPVLSFLLLSHEAYAQSYSCSPEHVTFAGNTTSGPKIEKTNVNWKRIDYHIVDKKAVSMTYKNPNDPATKINPTQRDELVVLENSPGKVVMLGGVNGKSAKPDTGRDFSSRREWLYILRFRLSENARQI